MTCETTADIEQKVDRALDRCLQAKQRTVVPRPAPAPAVAAKAIKVVATTASARRAVRAS